MVEAQTMNIASMTQILVNFLSDPLVLAFIITMAVIIIALVRLYPILKEYGE